MPTGLQGFVLTLITAASCALSMPANADNPKQPERIVYLNTAQAFANGVANDQVTVLVFGAEWCGACKKLERTVLSDPAVRKAAAGMSWSKIDIDKDPQLAAMFGVRAVPTMVFLNTKGEPLHQQAGLVSVQKMAALLEDYVGKAAQPGTARGREEQLLELVEQAAALPEGSDVPSQTVTQILELIAVPNPIGAEQTRHRLIAMGPSAWNALIDALEHRKLAVRAAAYDLLKGSTGHIIAYDPFLEVKERAKQVQAWREWLKAKRPTAIQPDPEPQDASSGPDEEEPAEPTTPRAPRAPR
ncbi:MAG: thioredoxin fold domain-containing protein [Phycisphaeraceae bacterium]|nr:thioredoxin fold domain-containing protein [Phycisphaeraceae bacterium]